MVYSPNVFAAPVWQNFFNGSASFSTQIKKPLEMEATNWDMLP